MDKLLSPSLDYKFTPRVRIRVDFFHIVQKFTRVFGVRKQAVYARTASVHCRGVPLFSCHTSYITPATDIHTHAHTRRSTPKFALYGPCRYPHVSFVVVFPPVEIRDIINYPVRIVSKRAKRSLFNLLLSDRPRAHRDLLYAAVN